MCVCVVMVCCVCMQRSQLSSGGSGLEDTDCTDLEPTSQPDRENRHRG